MSHKRQPVVYNTETEQLEKLNILNASDKYDEIDVGGSGSITIGGAYDNNTEAVAALGAGKLYKSSTLINGSPIILITL